MAGNGNIDFFCLECYTDKSEVNTLQTEVIKIDRENMDLDALKRAGEILKSGGLVAFPTETVYVLGGMAFMKNLPERFMRQRDRLRIIL